MKMGAGFCLVLWVFAMCIGVAVTYNNPDDELLSTGDIDTEINNGDWMDKSTVDDNLGSATSKRLHRTFFKPSSVDMQRLGDVRALVQALGTNTDKLDVRTLFPDKRTYEDLKTATEMIKANADKLDGLTTYVKMMKSEFMTMNADKLDDLAADVKMMKSQLMTINAGKLDELTADVSMLKSELMTTSADKLDDLTADVKTMKSELIEMNTNKLDDLTADVKMMKSELMTMKMAINHMDPLFVSMFVMLTEITFATSVRIAHHEEDMTEIVNNFQTNVKYGTDILDKKLPPVFEFYTGSGIPIYTSCVEHQKAGHTTSGNYWITIPNTSKTIHVYCDQDTDGGGWLVFQRRQDGTVDFYRDWADYKAGFGEVTGEFWLGNDHLHSLTQDQQELRVDLEDFNDTTAFAKYSTFRVENESENYRLTVSGYSGTAGYSLNNNNNGKMFSTKDNDNDMWSSGSCAIQRKGAWWYRDCTSSNLNGPYHDSAQGSAAGVLWFHWKKRSLKKTEMKIRPRPKE